MGWSGRALALPTAGDAKDKALHMLRCTEVPQQTVVQGQEPRFWYIPGTSAITLTADIRLRRNILRGGPRKQDLWASQDIRPEMC